MNGLSLILAQATAPMAAPQIALPPAWLQWFYVWGEPAVTDGRAFGGLITWSKVVGLYCLLAWISAWLLASIKSNTPGKQASPLKVGMLLGALIAGLLAAMVGVLDQTGRLQLAAIGGIKPGNWLAIFSGGLLVILIELQLFGVFRRKKAGLDFFFFLLAHVVLVLGYVVGFLWCRELIPILKSRPEFNPEELPDWRIVGGRIGVTFMGLLILIRIGMLVVAEAFSMRWRRIYSIAWQAIIEANRRNRAPYVVITLFVVVLAFTHWFLRSTGERDAELSRYYVNTLTLVITLLLTLMVVFLAPTGTPRDILNQTIYTVVTKPVRRLEMVWGRLLGYMVLVTFLLAVFGGASLLYLDRNIGGRAQTLRVESAKYESTKPEFSKLLAAQADQLESRMSARVPVKGYLTFLDSRGTPRSRGIDVGQEQDIRTHIEGATPAKAIWTFGIVPDRLEPNRIRDTRVPIASLLVPESIEGVEDRLITLQDLNRRADREKDRGDIKGSDVAKLASGQKSRNDEIATLTAELKSLRDQERALRLKAAASKDAAEKKDLKEQADKLHSPPIPVEMTFNIYRTTKGVVGDPVLASLTAQNNRVNEKGERTRPYRALFPIREYYTNKQSLPSSVLVGSGGTLTIEIQCQTANQYIGMSEGDFYILASQGGFRINFLKGLFGIWLQAMVLTSIGLFAGTFLSWRVALLVTLAFFVAGQIGFQFLAAFAVQAQEATGGGPFESLIRLLSHQNMMNALAPTPAVVVAKTLDAVVMPVMSRLVYLVPNFAALDVSNTVAEGFAVTWASLLNLTLMGIGYALPFSIAGYFILKNREVAA